jgi:hypothetical protein
MGTVNFSKFAVSLVALLALSAGLAVAQSHEFHGGGIAPRGVPASVTSFGFGGHPGFHGVPASVTSLGFGVNSGFRGVPGNRNSFGFDRRHGIHEEPFEFRHHHRRGFYAPFYGGYYDYLPYGYPYYSSDLDYGEDPSYDPQAAREFDDRQVLNNDYRAELNTPREPPTQPAAEPVQDQPSTVLIFKDGHQVEVANYAIVGATLYDLSDGRSKKVQLADLDLPATVKENDERGVEFQLPAQARVN